MKVYICRKCGQRAHVSHNRPDHPAMQDSDLITCFSRMCANFGLTKDSRNTDDIDALFIVEDDTSQDDLTLVILERRARALIRLGG